MAYINLYKETKSAYENVNGAKYCLSDLDISQGLTMTKKLEMDCPYYPRLDLLFGGRQNITPSFTMENGYDTRSFPASTRFDENEDDLSASSANSAVANDVLFNYFEQSKVPVNLSSNYRAPSPANLTQLTNSVSNTATTITTTITTNTVNSNKKLKRSVPASHEIISE